MEEVFRRAPNAEPFHKSVPKTLAKGTLKQILVFVALIAPFAIIVGVALSVTAVAGGSIPAWIPWVIGVVCYLLILRYGRRRGWY
jgi:hypothetical protein